jgi:predicted regulator of Ras-like GTPase activity (Roadblock/LC7/MglB family)
VDGTGGDDVGLYNSITIGVDGLPIISYYDSTNGNLRVAHCQDVACSSSTNTVVSSSGDIGRFTSITVGADNLPIISAYNSTGGNLKVAHCSNVACTSSTKTVVDGQGGDDVGLYNSITVGVDGLPIISYYDSTNGNLRVAHCSNSFCVSNFRRR